jgi:hypothetical protein
MLHIYLCRNGSLRSVRVFDPLFQMTPQGCVFFFGCPSFSNCAIEKQSFSIISLCKSLTHSLTRSLSRFFPHSDNNGFISIIRVLLLDTKRRWRSLFADYDVRIIPGQWVHHLRDSLRRRSEALSKHVHVSSYCVNVARCSRRTRPSSSSSSSFRLSGYGSCQPVLHRIMMMMIWNHRHIPPLCYELVPGREMDGMEKRTCGDHSDRS